jgi:hypothetical protein
MPVIAGSGGADMLDCALDSYVTKAQMLLHQYVAWARVSYPSHLVTIRVFKLRSFNVFVNVGYRCDRVY